MCSAGDSRTRIGDRWLVAISRLKLHVCIKCCGFYFKVSYIMQAHKTCKTLTFGFVQNLMNETHVGAT